MATSKADEAGALQGIHPPQLPLESQQYVVTINGDVTGQQAPVNLRAIKVTAILQLICAGTEIFLGVLAILAGCVGAMDAAPIWLGLAIFMVAGILGSVAVKKKTNCIVISYMVMSIIASLAAMSLCFTYMEMIFYEGGHSWQEFHPLLQLGDGGRMGIDGCIIIAALAEGIIAIVASAFCCRGTCCAPPRPLQIQYSPAVPAGAVVVSPGGGQPITIPQGQAIVINPTPPASYQPVTAQYPSSMTPPPAYMVNAAPPQNQMDTTTRPHDATDDDGTDRQALVE